ncbi:hypothetical protein [Streptomyces sp. HPF1205]|uniref:hypothetical protein n=1 Tax=Streptomyces sp. HPF1205 TaxID=2873262 RepID=UPI001CED395E|nr:hypothetical protein [Streptomyces sp. HPF1205]
MPHDHDHDRDHEPDDHGPDTTLRLDGPDTDAGEATRATLLDPDSWSSRAAPPTAATTAAPAAEPDGTVPQQPRTPDGAPYTGGLRRFGPGVPGPDTTAATARTAAVWHGTVRPGEPGTVPAGEDRRRRRALRGWLLPVVVLLGVLAYLAWQHFPSPVKVDGVAVREDTAVQGCHSTAKIIGTLRTSGGAGTVRYRWRRSDGTVSDELRQHVARGRRTTDVVLLWTFDGPGSLTATATLDVLAPQHRSASTTFAYRCR